MSVNDMITCRQLIAFIDDYRTEALTIEERSTFERHLDRCASCRAYLESYGETIVLSREAFDAPAVDVPEELVQAILSHRR